MSRSKKERILELLKESGILRPRDLEAIGISGVYLNKLYAEGLLERPSRGLYTLPDSEPSENRTIAEAGKRVPQGVVCLLSALRFHDLTTQAPFEVWLAIDEKARPPKIDFPPLMNKAREQKEDFGIVLARYGLERLLFRLSQSRHRELFKLKGAMVFQLWSAQPMHVGNTG